MMFCARKLLKLSDVGGNDAVGISEALSDVIECFSVEDRIV